MPSCLEREHEPPARSRPTTTSSDPPARQRPPGRLRRDLELDVDLAGERRGELADRRVEAAQALDALADDGQRVRRRVGLGQLVELGR